MFDVLDFDDAVYEEMVRLGGNRSDFELVIDIKIRREIAKGQIPGDKHRTMDTWQGISLVELPEDRGGYWEIRKKDND